MHQVQLIYDKLTDLKQKAKEIKLTVKDALSTSLEYTEFNEKLKQIRIKKKQVEETVKQSLSSELTKLDDLKIDIDSEEQLLNDKAMTMLMRGETVEIEDKYGNKYEPEFKVKFRKV